MIEPVGVGRTPRPGSAPAPFDVRGFARTAHGSLRDELDLRAIARAGLPPDAVRAVATLAQLEGATMEHLRNVLVTPTHKDARVTAFLVSWAYEKYWIADALRAMAEAGGSSAPAPRPSDGGEHGIAGRGPIRRALAGFGQGADVVGAHLALGFVDDLVLDLAHARLEAVPVPSVSHAIARIRAIKSRHRAFFAEEATSRLAIPRAARLARRELARSAWPLGAAAVTADRRAAFARFAVPDALARERLARGIRSLPGIDERTAAAVVRRLGA